MSRDPEPASSPQLARLYNAHTAPIRGVKPGQTGSFDIGKASTRAWLRPGPGGKRFLVPESEVMASRAGLLVPAASSADVLQVRQEIARKETVITELLAREKSRDLQVKELSDRLSAVAGELDHARGVASQNESLSAELASTRERLVALDALVHEQRERNDRLETDLASASKRTLALEELLSEAKAENTILSDKAASLEADLASLTAPAAATVAPEPSPKADDPPAAPPARTARRG